MEVNLSFECECVARNELIFFERNLDVHLRPPFILSNSADAAPFHSNSEYLKMSSFAIPAPLSSSEPPPQALSSNEGVEVSSNPLGPLETLLLRRGSGEGRPFVRQNYTLNANGGTGGGQRGSDRSRTSSATTTMTITQNNEANTPGEGGAAGEEKESIILRLESGPRVTWEEGVVNNEGLGRKSSKRCCIFSKRRAWDESSTESDSDGGQGSGSARPIARPKTKESVPDFQRFHA